MMEGEKGMSLCCKKIISLLALLSLLSGFCIPASAEVSDRVRVCLEGLELMQGYEDGSFGEEDVLTRAQMTVIVARMLRVAGTETGESLYSDVADDHWAKNEINTLSQMKIVSGVGDGQYLPEKSVGFYEVCKMLVSALGYDSRAEKNGGYPLGYVSVAGSLGMLKNVNAKEGAILRGDVAKMLYLALDVKPVERMENGTYVEMGETLYEILTDGDELVKLEGILTETAATSILTAEPAIDKGYIRIGDQKILSDQNMDSFIGRELSAYVYRDKDTDLYRLKNFTVNKNTTVTEADADDVYWENGTMVLEREDASDKKYKMSSLVKTVYNGRLANIPASERDIYYGNYVLVDNNGDGDADVLFINEAQSFIAERVNTKTSTVYFKNHAALNGRNAVVLDEDDTDKTVIITDTAGDALSVKNIEAGSGITIFASKDGNYHKAIVSADRAEGVVTESSDEGIRIDGELYKLALKPNGDSIATPEVGETAAYVLDAFGRVIDSDGAVKGTYQYAYIINAKHATGISGTLSMQTVSGLQPKKEVEKSGDDEIISYYFQNDEVRTYNCADTVLFNDVRTSCDKINAAQLQGKLAAFRLNAQGEVKELYTSDVPSSIASAYTFNANILSFGGESVLRGFATDENTVFVCVPENETTTDDYYVQVKVTDDSAANKVQGVVFFPDAQYEDANTEPVNILMIKATMESSTTPPVQLSDDICIVGQVKQVLGTLFDDVDSEVYKLELLKGSEKLTEVTQATGKAADVAKTLRKGDLIRYVKDGFGRVVNISKLVSIQGLGKSYSNDIFIGSGAETAIYGMAYHSVPSVYDYFSNQIVDRLQLAYDADGMNRSNTYRLFHEDMPMVYQYDRRNGYISAGDIEDIRTFTQVGSDADSILAVIENNDIKALVIIADR